MLGVKNFTSTRQSNYPSQTGYRTVYLGINTSYEYSRSTHAPYGSCIYKTTGTLYVHATDSCLEHITAKFIRYHTTTTRAAYGQIETRIDYPVFDVVTYRTQYATTNSISVYTSSYSYLSTVTNRYDYGYEVVTGNTTTSIQTTAEV